MTPEYRVDAEKRITEYLKSQGLVNIKNMQVEKTFNDLGHEVNIWNVRTKNDGNWWVAEGDSSLQIFILRMNISFLLTKHTLFI